MMNEEAIDLRAVPFWERAESVSARVRELPDGGSVSFLTDAEPRALLAHVEQSNPGRLCVAVRCLREGHWQATLTRIEFDPQASMIEAAITRGAVFSALGQPQRDHLAAAMRERSARKGDGIPADGVLRGIGLVLEGTLGVFIGAGTRERLLYQVFAGEPFGEVEFFDGGAPLGRTVAVSKELRYAVAPADLVRNLAGESPAFRAALEAAVAQRARRFAGALAAQTAQTILARIADALLPYAVPQRGMQPALPPLRSMTQLQLAAAAGTVKEVAARAIADLERAGALRRERGHIAYLDRVKLLETIENA